jgi:hypothetical protein
VAKKKSQSKSKDQVFNLSILDETELTALARAVQEEFQRRGVTTEVARIATEEARRLAIEEARKETERERKRAEDEKATEKAARIRALAVRARELFGSDQAEFKVAIWEKSGDKRVYISQGFDNNWVEYYHTGNSREAPKAIKIRPVILRDLAAHLGITRAEAGNLIKDYCGGICDGWTSVTVEVNTSNAPLVDGTLVTRYVIQHRSSGYYGQIKTRSFWTRNKTDADRFSTTDDAEAAVEKYCGGTANYLAKSAEEVKVVAITERIPFPLNPDNN